MQDDRMNISNATQEYNIINEDVNGLAVQRRKVQRLHVHVGHVHRSNTLQKNVHQLSITYDGWKQKSKSRRRRIICEYHNYGKCVVRSWFWLGRPHQPMILEYPHQCHTAGWAACSRGKGQRHARARYGLHHSSCRKDLNVEQLVFWHLYLSAQDCERQEHILEHFNTGFQCLTGKKGDCDTEMNICRTQKSGKKWELQRIAVKRAHILARAI